LLQHRRNSQQTIYFIFVTVLVHRKQKVMLIPMYTVSQENPDHYYTFKSKQISIFFGKNDHLVFT